MEIAEPAFNRVVSALHVDRACARAAADIAPIAALFRARNRADNRA